MCKINIYYLIEGLFSNNMKGNAIMAEQNTQTVNEFGSLASERSSKYAESIVQNYTGESIGVIDKFGVKTILPPLETASFTVAGSVVIKYRNSVVTKDTNPKPQKKQQRSVYEEPTLPGGLVSFKMSELHRSAMYVKEVDLLFCLITELEITEHPAMARSFDEAVNYLLDNAAKNAVVTAAQMIFIAKHNDVQFVLDHPAVYTILFGTIVSIPITVTTTDTPELTIRIREGYSILNTHSCSEIFAHPTEAYQLDVCGCSLVFALDKELLKNAAAKLTKLVSGTFVPKGLVSTGDVEAMRKAYEERAVRDKEEYTIALSTLKTSGESKIATLNGQLTETTNTNKALSAEIDKLKITNIQLQSIIDTWDRERTRDLSYSKDIAQTRRMNTVADSERVKLEGVVWKVVGGALIAGVTLLIAQLTKNK